MIVEHSKWAFNGYRLNEVMIEMYISLEWEWAENYGFRLATDYHDHYAAPNAPSLPAGVHPRLYSARREDLTVGTPMYTVFRYTEPQLYFTRFEQELLRWAMHGRTDEELAQALSISKATVRKRWESIYDKASIIFESLPGAADQNNTQGMEKKRRLLNYLRYHMEELRPVLPPKVKQA